MEWPYFRSLVFFLNIHVPHLFMTILCYLLNLLNCTTTSNLVTRTLLKNIFIYFLSIFVGFFLGNVNLNNLYLYCRPIFAFIIALLISFDWSTVSAWMQPHSWIEPHPTQNLIQPQSKMGFEKIETQLE